ncbi:hypothetical protein QL285_055916 [Trifolium repens]|jgi:hypothetical protein|nr:hypothetical protein QL285_055916 [Trifolium repens]
MFGGVFKRLSEEIFDFNTFYCFIFNPRELKQFFIVVRITPPAAPSRKYPHGDMALTRGAADRRVFVLGKKKRKGKGILAIFAGYVSVDKVTTN